MGDCNVDHIIVHNISHLFHTNRQTNELFCLEKMINYSGQTQKSHSIESEPAICGQIDLQLAV